MSDYSNRETRAITLYDEEEMRQFMKIDHDTFFWRIAERRGLKFKGDLLCLKLDVYRNTDLPYSDELVEYEQRYWQQVRGIEKMKSLRKRERARILGEFIRRAFEKASDMV